jgi:hypothetical protein
MFQFILGAAAGAAGMWAYQKWFGEPDDDDWDTGVWDQPTTSSYPVTQASSDSPSSSSAATASTASSSSAGAAGDQPSAGSASAS